MSSNKAALDVFRAVDTAFDAKEKQPEPQAVQEFVPSEWKGAIPGYAFKTGSSGLGYYLDALQAAPAAHQVDAAGPSHKSAHELLEVSVFVPHRSGTATLGVLPRVCHSKAMQNSSWVSWAVANAKGNEEMKMKCS